MIAPYLVTAIKREQAHIDRRAPIAELPQQVERDRRGKRPPKQELGRKG